MTDKFTCLSFERLLYWIKQEKKTGKIFGINKELFFKPSKIDPFKIKRYGKILETPIGVAAGPHTQLSQNIISAWLTGARYIELKTIQVMDDLDVTKPCIDMEDEGYNCEWSQELKLEQSFNEYLNAFVVIHILKKELGIDKENSPEFENESGFIFNMSVGYNMEGILSSGVQNFLDKMTNSQEFIQEKLLIAKKYFKCADNLKIPSQITDNITISTMHGCPFDEIEKITQYFIEEKKLNTTLKLNPTLLGSDKTRDILNNKLEFNITVPDSAFEHDLKYNDAKIIINNLLKKAEKAKVEFNLKLTNTLEVENRKKLLPEKEEFIYMSGRALHAISINLGLQLQKDFKNNLDISFCAGADCFNVADIIFCGFSPVTVCSDILKPGGYARLFQYIEEIKNAFKNNKIESISDFIKTKANYQIISNTSTIPESIADIINDKKNQSSFLNLTVYAENIIKDKKYNKKSFIGSNIKTKRKLHLFDCIHAPCKDTCPANQDVPAYVYYASKNMFEHAFNIIMQTNPFPSVQGMVCDHKCTQKCTRINYDNPVQIKEIKRFIAENQGTKDFALKPLKKNGFKVAVIGGGPSGFSAAYFLIINGFSVDVFEANDFPGGMPSHCIPEFRLDNKSIKADINRIISFGVNVKYNSYIDKHEYNKIRKNYNYVYIATGAVDAVKLDVPGSKAKGVYDHLEFLKAVKHGKSIDVGKNVIVIGGGNSAMDTARTAKRLNGLKGKNKKVIILYRRGINEMPGDIEEINDALKECIKIQEMTVPESIIAKNNKVIAIKCYKTKYGKLDKSLRPSPVIIENSAFEIKADTIISAIGQKIAVPFFSDSELKDKSNSVIKVDPKTCKTKFEKVYAGGDVIRGASTIIKAIADARKAVKAILKDCSLETCFSEKNKFYENYNSQINIKELEIKKTKKVSQNHFNNDILEKTIRKEQVIKESLRCLLCDTLCGICTTVCPNRANILYKAKPFKAKTYKAVYKNGKEFVQENGEFSISQSYQVFNLGDFCNECGNCTTFCPSCDSPYINKPKFYLTRESFDKENLGYFLKNDLILKKHNSTAISLKNHSKTYLFKTKKLTAEIDKKSFKVLNVNFKEKKDQQIDIKDALELIFLYISLKDINPFKKVKV
ncbi:MAG: hypothetical protein B6I26_04085 [Desulfobacteraceae bacterium 4572_130]|nr:MAG: hypothetical protein B6I26_04085 [Desulfobacteraceae bacterium 4572_130]